MVRQLISLALAASLVSASTGAQEAGRTRTTVRTGPYGYGVTIAGDEDRLVLGLSTSSGGMRDTLGLLVSSITADSPAEKAGLEEGNRITAINGVSLKLNPADAGDPDMAGVLGRRFQRELDKMKSGEAVTLRVYANGQNREMKVTPVRADELRPMRGTRGRTDERPTIGASLGGFASPRDTMGVFVVAVAEDGPLAKAGVFEGSRIASINGVDLRVPSADVGDDFMTSSRVRRLTREIEKLAAGGNAELRVYSNGQSRSITVKTVKRSELKQGGGVSIFHSGGGTGVFMPPMIDMPGFRFDMNHDIGDEVRQRIEESLRGREIQFRSRQDRIRDDGLDSVVNDAARREIEEGSRRVQPFFTMAALPTDGRLGFRSQAVQAAQAEGPQPRPGRSSGTATYNSRASDPSTQGAVFMVAGIRLSPINAQLATYLGAGSERGLLVLEIENTWSGLIAGDVLLSIDGRAVCDRGDTFVFIDVAKDQGIEILRGGETVKGTLRRR